MKKTYTEQEIHKILDEQIEVPESVNNRIDETLQKLKEQNKVIPYVKKPRTMKRSIAAAALCIIALSGITVTAATLSGWNKDVAKRFQADEKQQQELSEKKVTVPIDAKAQNGGYTIKMEQALCSNKYMYFYFTIMAPKGENISNDIGFKEVSLLVDGVEFTGEKYAGSYCSGVPDEESMQENWNKNYIHYEFWIEKSEGESLSGKTMTARFNNMYFGTTQDEENIKKGPEGTWDISWTMDYESNEKEYVVNQKLEKDDITVKKILLSPISIEVEYDWKRMKKTVLLINEDGTEGTTEVYVEPAVWATGLKLEDGSIEELDTSGMGTAGFVSEDEKDTIYKVSNGCGKINDMDNVVAVIFQSHETGEVYEVAIK